MATATKLNSRYNMDFDYNYQSIAGTDIKITLGGRTFGNVQAVSYSISREKAPNYTMGSADPRGFSRGKRGIAGSMVTLMFDSHALIAAARDYKQAKGVKQNIVIQKDEPRPGLATFGSNNNVASDKPRTTETKGLAAYYESALIDGDPSNPLDGSWEEVAPWYTDQIPPFNITMTAVNEMGAASQMAILGVEILNEGHGMSIDDLQAEHQFTFVARMVSHWSQISNTFRNGRAGVYSPPFTKG